MTSKELDTIVNDMDDMSISRIIDSMDPTDRDFNFSQSDLMQGQQRLASDIKDLNRRRRLYKISAVGAAILLPLTAVLVVMLFHSTYKMHQLDNMLSQRLTLVTANGETLHTLLPDGSTVTMGPKSTLSYSLASFYSDRRKINYQGEGSFSITKVPDKTFVLESSNFEIEVLGTEFSLLSRDEKANAEIYLAAGSIQLTALQSDESIIMKPGETAILSKATGAIALHDANTPYRRTAGQSTIYFKSASINSVAHDIETYYGYKVHHRANLEMASFTGSLPTDNLNQAVYILENTLRVKITVDEREKAIYID